MESIKDDHGGSAEGFNYFNYFTEVEEEFVRRRGKHMLISPIDWALVESWKNAGIPLHIVLRAINLAFDAYDARPSKYRMVNTIFYCQQSVEVTFAEYRLAQVGGGPTVEKTQQIEGDEPSTPATQQAAFPREVILEFLARCNEQLGLSRSQAPWADRSEAQDAVSRARSRLNEITAEIEGSVRVDAEALERDLDAVDRMIMESAERSCGEEEIKKIRADAQSQLRSYRKKMDKAIYEQTLQNFVARRLREIYNIPRLSLFYL